ncbi:hypothetical protein [Nocardioides sp. LHG3406-4]|uniref:hypothetical protein n=1 Tax=Nocardioides sp. LHG3406-4 TaxID=2804575 RepID=UPI003CF2DFB9
MSARRRVVRLAVCLGLLALAPLLVVSPDGPSAAAEPDGPAYSQTKHLTRTFLTSGEELVVDERDVTVSADRTTDLRGRERINISWTGAHPTGGRAASPYGEQGLLQEYPVVILQCRGVDDPALPPEQQLSPSTCWTSTRQQRSQLVDESSAAWRHDLYATEADRAAKSGLVPVPEACNDVESFSTHITPFVAADGTVSPSCTAETMAPEAAVGAAFPPAEMAAYTDVAGNGSVKFEVRSAVENESLGCSDQVRCSVVVIPIQGLSCADDDRECRKSGRFEPGASNFANDGVDASVSPSLWWAESNWRNRFSIPVTFGLAPDACDVLDDRPPTGFYGSELMAQAALQWSPAYCLRKDRFKFQHNKMSDEAAFALMENGGGAAALVSGVHKQRGEDPVAYAPTAVTGFTIAYVVDRPDNAGEVTDLKLTPRLLAKLLTQSYVGSERGAGHPGMSANPASINLDPEFQALNPGLDLVPREAAATLLSLSESSDVVETLTGYLAQDKDAAAFVAGKADPWGMVVNPSYKKITLPRAEWPLLDSYVPPSNQECYQQNPSPYFTQLAAPVTSMRKVAEAVLDAWPNVQTKCDRSTTSDPWRVGRADRQGVGARFMLGVVSLGDARRFGLREAALATSKGAFVSPTQAALAKAVSVARPPKKDGQPFTLDVADVVKSRSGYPGTMVVYTAARTSGLDEADAGRVADFIKIATSEGQQPGSGNGELPEGYLPLAKSGPTAPLLEQARAVAASIRDQKAAPTADDDADDPVKGDDGNSPGAKVPDTTPDAPPPAADPATGKPDPAKAPEPEAPEPVAMPDTVLVSSGVAGGLVPVLLGVVVLGAACAGLLRVATGRRRAR